MFKDFFVFNKERSTVIAKFSIIAARLCYIKVFYPCLTVKTKIFVIQVYRSLSLFLMYGPLLRFIMMGFLMYRYLITSRSHWRNVLNLINFFKPAIVLKKRNHAKSEINQMFVFSVSWYYLQI